MNFLNRIDAKPFRKLETQFYFYDIVLFVCWVIGSILLLALFKTDLKLPAFLLPAFNLYPMPFLFALVIFVVSFLGVVPLYAHMSLSKRFRDEPRIDYLKKVATKYKLKIFDQAISTKERYYGPTRYWMGHDEYPLVWQQEVARPYGTSVPEFTLASGSFKGRKLQVGVYELKGFIPHLEVIYEHKKKGISHLVRVHVSESSFAPAKDVSSEINNILNKLVSAGSKKPTLYLGPKHLRLVMRYTSFYDLEHVIQAGLELVKVVEKRNLK